VRRTTGLHYVRSAIVLAFLICVVVVAKSSGGESGIGNGKMIVRERLVKGKERMEYVQVTRWLAAYRTDIAWRASTSFSQSI
jgi:hypothetical protein